MEEIEDEEIASKFKFLPAAKSIHHAYLGGLIEHKLTVCKVAIDIGKVYKLNNDLLIFGALFHDIGKVIEIEVGRTFEYSHTGKLLGHIVIGANILDRKKTKYNTWFFSFI